jgi:hypothetical protein
MPRSFISSFRPGSESPIFEFAPLTVAPVAVPSVLITAVAVAVAVSPFLVSPSLVSAPFAIKVALSSSCFVAPAFLSAAAALLAIPVATFRLILRLAFPRTATVQS